MRTAHAPETKSFLSKILKLDLILIRVNVVNIVRIYILI